jgi:hypothetical protein
VYICTLLGVALARCVLFFPRYVNLPERLPANLALRVSANANHPPSFWHSGGDLLGRRGGWNRRGSIREVGGERTRNGDSSGWRRGVRSRGEKPELEG